MGRRKKQSVWVALFTALFAIAIGIVRLALRTVSGLLGMVNRAAGGKSEHQTEAEQWWARREQHRAEYEAKFSGMTFAEPPNANDPNRPPRGDGKNLPGYDEPPCQKCGGGCGPDPTAFRKPDGQTVYVYCGRCFAKLKRKLDTPDAPQIETMGRPPDSWLQSHLPKTDTPPRGCNAKHCSRCGEAFKKTFTEYHWLPTNENIRLCPKCYNQVLAHCGFSSQIHNDRVRGGEV